MWGWRCHRCGNFPHILLCWPSYGLSLLRWCRLCVGSCCSGLGHQSCVVRSLVLVRNTSNVAWLWCNGRWCRTVLWMLGDRAYDVVCSMRCPWCILVGGVWMVGIWNDDVQISRLGVDKVKLLGFQYGLFFRLGTFGCNDLCYGWEQGLEEPIQEDHDIKLDLT